MRKLTLLTVLAAGAALVACDQAERDHGDEDAFVEPAPMEPAPATDEAPLDGATEGGPASEAEPYAPPLPDDTRTSEETVQPESETLFY